MININTKKKIFDIRMHMFNYEPFYSLLIASFDINLVSNKDLERILDNNKIKIINNIIYADQDFFLNNNSIKLSTYFIIAIESYLSIMHGDEYTSKWRKNIKNDEDEEDEEYVDVDEEEDEFSSEIDADIDIEYEDEDDIEYQKMKKESADKELKSAKNKNSEKNEENKKEAIRKLERIEKQAYNELTKAKLDKFIPEKIKEKYDKKDANKLEWKEILRDYLMEENADFSFSPPDKRYNECDYFIPDFNFADNKIENLVFMIDTSGSMNKEIIDSMISEVKNITSQFKGKFSAHLGFFDDIVNEIIDIDDGFDFDKLSYKGKGGTSFIDIFDKVDKLYGRDNIKAVVILTDGQGAMPSKERLLKYPLIWILCGEGRAPDVGKIIRY